MGFFVCFHIWSFHFPAMVYSCTIIPSSTLKCGIKSSLFWGTLFQLRSGSHRCPHWALPWWCRVCLGFSPSLSALTPLSLSKQINEHFKKVNLTPLVFWPLFSAPFTFSVEFITLYYRYVFVFPNSSLKARIVSFSPSRST